MKRSFSEGEKDDFYEQIALSCYNIFNELSSCEKPSLNE